MTARPSGGGPRPACPPVPAPQVQAGRQARELAEGMAAILAGIKAGDADRVRRLLDDQPDLVGGLGENGDTPLLIATYYRAEDLIRLLLERGAPVSLFEAASLGDAQRVRQILDDQPELLAAYSHDGWTPLHLAAHFGQLQVVDLLLARGAEVDARSTNDLANTALHAALAGGSRATARRLVEQGADVNAIETGGFMPLHQAAELGDAEMARFLVEHGARTDARTDDQQTPEDIARAKGRLELAEWLSRPAGRS